MTIRILHVSDLHRRHQRGRRARSLVDVVRRRGLRPELVVATRRLTHRGRREQHERAAAFLRSLGPPVVAVPGNHDIPYTFPARFTRPWAEFERLWETTRAGASPERLCVVGLNSVRPWRHQSGGLRDGSSTGRRRSFAGAADGALRVALLHHQLSGAPWRTRKRPVARRNHVLGALVDAGAELDPLGPYPPGAVTSGTSSRSGAAGSAASSSRSRPDSASRAARRRGRPAASSSTRRTRPRSGRGRSSGARTNGA